MGLAAAALVVACSASEPLPPPPPPASSINLSRAAVAFTQVAGSSTAEPDTVLVTADSGAVLMGIALGAITYGAGASGWLVATVNGTTAPAVVELALAASALKEGSYVASVPVTATAAGNSPQVVRVTLTLTAPPAPVIMVGAGDVHAECRQGGTDAATAALLDGIGGTVFTLGDNAGNGSLASYTDCYSRTWGRHFGRTRPALGNHDYDTGDATGFFTYFGAGVGDSARPWYSYDLGGWHVVVLNSEVAVSETSPQYAWLRADLAASKLACTLAMWHQPRFGSGVHHGNAYFMGPMWNVLYEFGAELVLNGHEHHYERFAPQTPAGVADEAYGIREIIAGTAGTASANMYPFTDPVLPNSVARDNTAPGVLKLVLSADHYSWSFVPIAGASWADTGTGRCHGRPPASMRIS